MTSDQQREHERFKLVWKMIVQAWKVHPHAFNRGSSQETLCHWVHQAAKDINSRKVEASRWPAVWAPNLGPGEIRRALMMAVGYGKARIVRVEGRCTRFFIL